MTAHAPPFQHDPSSVSQRVTIACLAFVATAISAYLAAFQWGWIDSVWSPFGTSSEAVLTSPESGAMRHLIGIPDAALGAWAYSTEAVLSLAGSQRRWQFRPWLVILFGLDIIPLGFVSVALAVVQGVSVGAWCGPCLLTAAISVVLMRLAYDEVWASISYLRDVWAEEPDPAGLWMTFIGRPTPSAIRIALEQGS